MNDIVEQLNIYIKMNWCSKKENLLDQYECFLRSVIKIQERKDKVLRDIILNDKELKFYLMIHSVFPADIETNGDWLCCYMASILKPNQEDIDRFNFVQEIPKEYMDKLSVFDPIPAGISIDPVKISYSLWRDRLEEGSDNPILIVENGWEFKKKNKRKDPEEFLSKFDSISTIKNDNTSYLETDDIPF